MTDCNSPVITALDFPDKRQALQVADRLDPALTRVKVGKELFTRAGPDVVEALHKRGFDVFLDLKYHDIPNTVAGACRAAAELGVWMINVHASGGRKMLDAARDAVAGSDTLLIGVTVLTSLEAADLEAVGLSCDVEEQVIRLASLTADAGLHGVVCSALECNTLRTSLGPDFLLVTPGVRPNNDERSLADARHDQRRVMTPAEALNAGSDFLVIGRPITTAENPCDALQGIVDEIAEAA